MKKNLSLYFIRHGKLSLPYKDHNEMPFEILADLAIEKLNPALNTRANRKLFSKIAKIIPFKDISRIYTGPSKRCRDSAKLISKIILKQNKRSLPITVIRNLREVEFDLRKIYSKKFYHPGKIQDLNKSVLKAMLNKRYAESLAKTYQRADAIFKSIARFPKNDEKFLLITHGFFMRVLELYIKKHGAKNIKIAPQDLLRTKRNTYFRGFATDYKLSTFLRF